MCAWYKFYLHPTISEKNDSEARLLKDNSNNCKIESIVEAIANGKMHLCYSSGSSTTRFANQQTPKNTSRIRCAREFSIEILVSNAKPTTIITTLPIIIAVSFSRYPFIDAPFVILVCFFLVSLPVLLSLLLLVVFGFFLFIFFHVRASFVVSDYSVNADMYSMHS